MSGANLVYAGYCSSDAWVGDIGPALQMGWYFRGQAQVEALLRTISSGPVAIVNETRIHFANHTHEDVNITTYSTPLAPGGRLLFGGCSAGARGVRGPSQSRVRTRGYAYEPLPTQAMFNIDFLAPMLPPGVALHGFFDSPMWVDMLPLESNITSLENQTQSVFALLNPSARLDDACMAAYPGAEGWRCLFGQYRIPFVRVPYLLSASQFDKYQLPYNEGSSPPYAAGPARAYADTFQATVRDVMLQLPTVSQPGSAVYSSACFKHCVCIIGSFWGVRVGGRSLAGYLALWFWGSRNVSLQLDALPASAAVGGSNLPADISSQWIESCVGFGDGALGCGECHAKHPLPAPPLPPAHQVSGMLASSPVVVVAGARQASARARDALHAVAAAMLVLLLALALCFCGGGGGGGGGGDGRKAGGVELGARPTPAPSAATPLLAPIIPAAFDGRLVPRGVAPPSARSRLPSGFVVGQQKRQW